MITAARTYEGGELELFQHASNWKAYLAHRLRPFIRGDVAEVGAGLGAMTAVLCRGDVDHWLCLEPDSAMAAGLDRVIDDGGLPAACQVLNGVLTDLPEGRTFDSILYIDVLEHIEDDRAELERAALRLKPGGFLVVLAPAHQWLFSPFDRAIGHYRRYSVKDSSGLTPSGARSILAEYLDSVGLLASLANKVLLRSSMPTMRQVLIWDRLMAPISRVLDRALFSRLGKSVLFVWRKDA